MCAYVQIQSNLISNKLIFFDDNLLILPFCYQKANFIFYLGKEMIPFGYHNLDYRVKYIENTATFEINCSQIYKIVFSDYCQEYKSFSIYIQPEQTYKLSNFRYLHITPPITIKELYYEEKGNKHHINYVKNILGEEMVITISKNQITHLNTNLNIEFDIPTPMEIILFSYF